MNCDKLTYISKLHWLQNIIYIFNKIVINSLTTRFVYLFMQYFVHFPSNIIFRWKNEVVNFLLYREHPPKLDTSKKRKQCQYIIFNNIQAMN